MLRLARAKLGLEQEGTARRHRHSGAQALNDFDASPAALAGTRVDHITLADSGAPVISIYVVDDTGAYTGVRKMTFDGRVF